MKTLRILRNLAFLAMMATILAANTPSLLASWQTWCDYSWPQSLGCSCSGPSYAKVIHCDFDDNLWEDYCVDLQNDMYFQCNDYCEGPEYQDWAAFWTNTSEYPQWWKDECIVQWGDAAGQCGPEDSWARCDCSYLLTCKP